MAASPSPSSSSALSFGSAASGRGMGEVELDAARALAEFAHLAVMEREARGRLPLESREWGTTARRSSVKRAGGEPARSSESGRRLLLLDLNQNASALEEQHHDPESEEADAEMKVDSPCNPDVLNFSSQSPSKNMLPFGGSRSKQCVSESEKEARRLRRILANRESARQTIRRRQALREELMRKADTLSQDNEAMKKEKELILKEYLSLKDTNRHLKQKVCGRVKLEAEEVPTEDDVVEFKGCASIDDKPPRTTRHLPSIQLMWPSFGSYGDTGSGCALGSSNIHPYTWIHAITCSSGDQSEDFPMRDCIDPSEAYALEGALGGCNRTENEASTSSTCGRMGDHRLLKGLYPAVRYPLSEVGGSICCSVGNTMEIPHDSKRLKKALDAAAAAEARRRRKELKKPKHFCTR